MPKEGIVIGDRRIVLFRLEMTQGKRSVLLALYLDQLDTLVIRARIADNGKVLDGLRYIYRVAFAAGNEFADIEGLEHEAAPCAIRADGRAEAKPLKPIECFCQLWR